MIVNLWSDPTTYMGPAVLWNAVKEADRRAEQNDTNIVKEGFFLVNPVTRSLNEAAYGRDRGTGQQLDGLDRGLRIVRAGATITEVIGPAHR